jgi:hypothetical protein
MQVLFKKNLYERRKILGINLKKLIKDREQRAIQSGSVLPKSINGWSVHYTSLKMEL